MASEKKLWERAALNDCLNENPFAAAPAKSVNNTGPCTSKITKSSLADSKSLLRMGRTSQS